MVEKSLDTEVGKIVEAVYGSQDVKPPLLVRMERFAQQIGFTILGASVLVAMVAAYQGYKIHGCISDSSCSGCSSYT